MKTPAQIRQGRAALLFAALLPLLALVGALAAVKIAAPAAPPAPTAESPPTAMVATLALPAPATPPRVAAEPPVAAPARTFDDRIDELVALGRRTAERAQDDDHDGAAASDREARARFDELMAAFADAGERALRGLVAAIDAPVDGFVQGRELVLQLVVVTACARRAADADASGDRSPIDRFVHDVLAAIPANAAMAVVGERALARQPHLRLAHETAVLRLVELAGAGAVPQATATALLLTLWDNLQRFGERSSAALAALALALVDGADPSQRLAACRHLLRDPRYRAIALASLQTRGDRAFVADVATAVAQDLPVDDALGVLAELGPTLGRAPHAYLVCGHRDPDVVADAYRRLLADDVQPDRRADLVAGVGMARTATGLDVARTALAHDPSPAVRLQAVFALTANADLETALAALLQAADDAALTADPLRCDGLAYALQNLERHGDADAIDRATRRLGALSLSASGRAALAAIRERALPGGGASAPGGGR
ncbi:MAG: hypothetical protein FJ301_11490 [Planctomycetes bacterium]|nr:hypothetical protein [Planctomycetota bacterium]